MLRAHLVSFNTSKSKFLEENKKYSTQGVSNVENNPTIFKIDIDEPLDPFSPLSDCIHNAILIYDKSTKRNNLLERKSKFMSAFKHVDNIIKHNKDIYIGNLTMPAIQGRNLNKPCIIDGLVYKQTKIYELILRWQDISSISCSIEWQRQRQNYIDFLKNNVVVDTIEDLDRIVKLLL